MGTENWPRNYNRLKKGDYGYYWNSHKLLMRNITDIMKEFDVDKSPNDFENIDLKFKILDAFIEEYGISIPSTDLGNLTNSDSLANYFWDRQLRILEERKERKKDKQNPMPKNLKVFY